MPITDFQRSVLLLLKPNRNPESYVAGGIAIHRQNHSKRYSNDIDFFHDADEAVSHSYQVDSELLLQNRFIVRALINQPSFIRGVVEKGENSLKLEWVRDTAFRFFPVAEDSELGYRLHDIDLAVNKVLALANRNEVRDIIDLLQLNETTIDFASACWAACGKDPGFTPDLLLDCISRHSIIRPEQLSAELLAVEITPQDLKRQWLSLLNQAKKLLQKPPSADLGCLYLEADGSLAQMPLGRDLSGLRRHFGSLGGSWPRLV